MTEFNVASWDAPYAEPIIDVKEVFVKSKCLSAEKVYKKELVKVVCLINSNDHKDMNKVLTVRQILERLKQYDGELELCSADKDHDFNSYNWVNAIINVFDETDNHECEKCNISNDYNGRITLFCNLKNSYERNILTREVM